MSGPVIGSLCTGYGGLDMAVQAVLGGELAWVADPDRSGRGPDQCDVRPGQPDPDRRPPAGTDWGPYRPAIRRWEAVLGRPAPRPTDAAGRLNPVFVEWMMGLPAGHVTAVPGLTRTAQLKALGNGVLPDQAAAALHHLLHRAQSGAPEALGEAA
ncbi:hypothetical protein ACFVUH_07805 [Kitasatospora sp. NPDC058032]|uniref:hypothetical protein n=1 Tax=Kitasatospora sp. NPDC058032 TaxID=3346307 RepID=UPI0036DA251F